MKHIIGHEIYRVRYNTQPIIPGIILALTFLILGLIYLHFLDADCSVNGAMTTYGKICIG